jgi:hypothetical protein
VNFSDLDFGDPQIGATLHVRRWVHFGYGASLRADELGTLFVVPYFFGALANWAGVDP